MPGLRHVSEFVGLKKRTGLAEPPYGGKGSLCVNPQRYRIRIKGVAQTALILAVFDLFVSRATFSAIRESG